jgi:energy-converting hydrogenase Eha subunit A
MDRGRVLGTVSAVQLSAGIAGMVLALHRRRAYHLPLLHGHPDNVARDSLVLGTAFSPPVVMIGVQAVATARALRGGHDGTGRVLGALGAAMTAGYLGEQLVRRRLRRSGWDPVESPVVALGITTAAMMAGLGLKSGQTRQ